MHRRLVIVSYILILLFLISAICTVLCENGGQCIGPDTCNCTENWESGTCGIGN